MYVHIGGVAELAHSALHFLGPAVVNFQLRCTSQSWVLAVYTGAPRAHVNPCNQNPVSTSTLARVSSCFGGGGGGRLCAKINCV